MLIQVDNVCNNPGKLLSQMRSKIPPRRQRNLPAAFKLLVFHYGFRSRSAQKLLKISPRKRGFPPSSCVLLLLGDNTSMFATTSPFAWLLIRWCLACKMLRLSSTRSKDNSPEAIPTVTQRTGPQMQTGPRAALQQCPTSPLQLRTTPPESSWAELPLPCVNKVVTAGHTHTACTAHALPTQSLSKYESIVCSQSRVFHT